ncbi:sugar ABC transporter substrate-binding protein [Streptomyces sp. NPDC058457]|uniref:sugar ABC transporter substrate-binding protein n=1 Tax=Streptomyces sp. NPDC058457 TaxID=3346507 RepID=UPI00365C1D84
MLNGRNRSRELLAACTVLALTLVGCGSSKTNSGSSGDAKGSVPATVAAAVKAARQPIDTFAAPGPAINTSKITGGKVYVIVPALEVQDFSVVANEIKSVFSRFGVDVEACGTTGGSPDGVANCLQQAINAKAIGIVTVGITQNTAPSAIAAVAKAGIPLVNGVTTSSGPGDPKLVSYVTPNFVKLHSWLTDQFIADSKGSAHVLAMRTTSNDITPAWANDGVVKVLKDDCGGCSSKVIDVNTVNQDKIPTEVSTSLVADSSIKYIVAGTNNYVPDVVSGAQAAGRSATDTQVGTVGGSLAVMQQLGKSQWTAAVAAFSLPALSWYLSDSLLRLMVGQPRAGALDFPFQRLFTSANVTGLDLTQKGWSSGSWYGKADYVDGFLKLWGKK